MARTIDETFILQLYKEAKQLADVSDPLDRYAIGESIGLQARGVETICKTLLRTNFIKQDHDDPNLIMITANGIRLAEQLMDER